MYCERCGKQINDSLNFCNGCGAQLRKEKEKDEEKSVFSGLLSALIAVAVVGFGVLVGFTAILLDKIEKTEAIFAFVLAYLATLFAVLYMIGRQLAKVIDRKMEAEPRPKTQTLGEPQTFVQLPPKSTNPLEDLNGPASVTEHTTRTLDEVPVERR
ncbi:MAG TPA: zinc ribbon domain-containing protein [Pyrinomonadaceae bacterium]|nr:zinc ribbon domain-containing protein [Pyrinomonadaceae bacterium]